MQHAAPPVPPPPAIETKYSGIIGCELKPVPSWTRPFVRMLLSLWKIVVSLGRSSCSTLYN